MPIAIPRETLRRSFSLCNAFVPTRTTDDSLKYIRLVVTPAQIEMIATDGQSSIAHKILGIDANGSEGNLMLPAARFDQILKEANGDEIKLTGKDGELTVVEGGSEYRLQVISVKDAPKFELPQNDPDATIKIAAKTLMDQLGMTVIATDPDATRFVLGAVRLENNSEGEFLAVATDSRRLSLARGNCDGDGQFVFHLNGPDAKRIIAAGQQLAESADVVIKLYKSRVAVALGNSLIVCREVEGRFPSWQSVVPKPKSLPVTVVAKDFASIIRQAKLGIDERDESASKDVNLEFAKGTLKAFAGDGKSLGSKIELPIAYDGPKIALSFNPDYLTQWLRILDPAQSVEWNMTDADSAVLLVAGDAKYVVMPLARD